MSSMSEQEWGVAISDTELAREWVREVSHELSQLSRTLSMESKRWESQSIYRIPERVRELRSSAYDPKTVSIGPYHHGNPRLWSMEEHKHRALLAFLDRSKKPLHCYIKALAPVVEELKDAYDQLEIRWREDTDAFLKLMILDGCFILEIMRMATGTGTGYKRNDPVFGDNGRLYLLLDIRSDMLKLENQVPLQLLLKLLVVEDGHHDSNAMSKEGELSMLILKFFSQIPQRDNMEEYGKCLHILDLYRRSLLLPPFPWQKTSLNSTTEKMHVGSASEQKGVLGIGTATELEQAGIVFMPSKTSNLNDVLFQGSTLRLPQIIVDETLDTQYLNMMALERLHAGTGDEVSSFVFFMDFLIDKARDVAVLDSYGVLVNLLGTNRAVAELFRSMSIDLALDPSGRLFQVFALVYEYCRKPVPRMMAFLRRKYFTNPWATVSIVPAISAFAFTGFQTLYTVLAYYNRSDDL